MKVELHIGKMWAQVPLLLVLFGACNVACSGEREKLPDIVIYLVDTLRADHTQLGGYGLNTSPFLGQLAHSPKRTNDKGARPNR